MSDTEEIVFDSFAAAADLMQLDLPEHNPPGYEANANSSTITSDNGKQVRRHIKRRWTTLTREHIVALADEYHDLHGKWPNKDSGPISNTRFDSWCGIDQCLTKGSRGLPGGSSLKKLLIEEGRLPPAEIRPDLDTDMILAWADAFYARTKTWPTSGSGIVAESTRDTWEGLDRELRRGRRGLRGGTSLSRLLNENRGVPTYLCREPLTREKILQWADAHYDRTGQWPTRDSGEVYESPGEAWSKIDAALMQGHRGLQNGSSIARLLAECRGKLHIKFLPDLDPLQINIWVLNYYTRMGRLPRVQDGKIAEAPDVSWAIIDNAFRFGRRGLQNSGFRTLKEFLNSFFSREVFGQRVFLKPRLSINIILKWADAHHNRTGKWPNINSGDIPEAPGETWLKVNHEMYRGFRGIGEPTTLVRVLEEHRGMRRKRRGPLTIEQILKWADAHRARTGEWPHAKDKSEIPGAPFETWYLISCALHQGTRGLPVGSSLPMLLLTYRGRPHRKMTPALELDAIETWVLAHLERHKRWPTVCQGGVVDESPNESWRNIDGAFKSGSRGLKNCGYRSLDDFMVTKMGKPLSVHRGHWKSELMAMKSA